MIGELPEKWKNSTATPYTRNVTKKSGKLQRN
jgi:hypothetical protein